MKPILLLLLIVLLISCGQTQYLTVSNKQAKNDPQGLIIENDTMKIVYHFRRSFLFLSVYNKSVLPLEINWKKSGFLINEKLVVYHLPSFSLESEIKVDSARSLFNNISYTGSLKGTLTAQDHLQFLPPQTGSTKSFDVLPYRKLKGLPFSKSELAIIPTGRLKFSYRKLSYSAESSPLTFRSFLTYSLDGKEYFIDHKFYVSEIWQSKSGPNFLPSNLVQKKDWFIL